MSEERWYADGGTVRDENGLAVAHVVGQDEDNSDTVLLAAAPAMLADLRELRAILRGEHDNAHDSSAAQVDAALAVIEARLSSM